MLSLSKHEEEILKDRVPRVGGDPDPYTLTLIDPLDPRVRGERDGERVDDPLNPPSPRGRGCWCTAFRTKSAV